MRKGEKKLIVLLHLAVLLFWAVVFAVPSHFDFLIWNVFLALIPLDFAILYRKAKQGTNIWIQCATFLLWFFFFPNAMYLLTDFSHLSAIGTGLANTAQYLNYGFLFMGLMFGMLIGLSSLEMIVETVQAKSRQRLLIFYTAIAFLSALAIYLGRFARINSWDIFTNPQLIVSQLFTLISWDMFVFIVIFGLIQLLIFIIYHLIWKNH